MMVKDYHKNIIKIIEELASKKQHLKINPLNRQLKIEHTYKVEGFFYNPDIYFVNTKNNKYLIFEILDSQKKDKTIADICRIIFFKKCYKAIFVVKTDEQKEDIELIVDTIKVIFHDMIYELLGEKKIKELDKEKIIRLVCLVINDKASSKKIKNELNKLF